MDKVNSEKQRWIGARNRRYFGDIEYPLPPMRVIDRYSRCFVTQAAHIDQKHENKCYACGKSLTVD